MSGRFPCYFFSQQVADFHQQLPVGRGRGRLGGFSASLRLSVLTPLTARKMTAATIRKLIRCVDERAIGDGDLGLDHLARGGVGRGQPQDRRHGDLLFAGGLDDNIKPRQIVMLGIKRADGKTDNVPLVLRIDTPIEVDYYQHGGIRNFRASRHAPRDGAVVGDRALNIRSALGRRYNRANGPGPVC